MTTTAESTSGTTTAEQPHPLRQALVPLALDVAVPLGTYYLLHAGLGIGTAAALGLSSVIWGGWLLAECVVRLAGALLLPVSTMAWLGTVVLIVAIAGACVTGGAAVAPLEELVAAHAGAASSASARDEER